MKDLEQFEKEASEIVITISKKDFIDKATEVCAEEATKFPIGAMFTLPIVKKLVYALFDDKKDNGEENKID